MVRIFYLQAFAGIVLGFLTYLHFTPKNYFNECSLKIVTYSSFFEGPGKLLFKEYEDQYLCKLNVHVLKTAGMIAQIKNLSQDFDIILGLDQYQLASIEKMDFEIDEQDFKPERYGLESYKKLYINPAFKLDSAPLTYFIKRKVELADNSDERFKSEFGDNEDEVLGFYTFDDFQIYIEKENLKIAIPSPNTSVLGSLYLNWILDYANNPLPFLKLKSWVYVSSWTEAFGLFEKSLVGGFLSYETSHIHFKKQNQMAYEKNMESKSPKAQLNKVFKVEIQSGHPDYVEYFLVSNKSPSDKKDKYRFVNFMFEEKSQMILLNKNYMWPAIIDKSKQDYQNKSLKVVPLKNTLTKSEILKIWKGL